MLNKNILKGKISVCKRLTKNEELRLNQKVSSVEESLLTVTS